MKQTKYPIYIISKGRYNNCLTANYFEKEGLKFYIVVEPQEYELYVQKIHPSKILVLPFSNLNIGAAPARNWVWEHAIKNGSLKHWQFDDNIRRCNKYNKGKFKIITYYSAIVDIENYVDKYTNVGLAAMQYKMFVTHTTTKAIVKNKRVYSAMLIDNKLPYRWRLPFNSDVDLSLQVLHNGLCTLLFNVYSCEKQPTMSMKGGNTERYKKVGRYIMSKTIYNEWPQYIEIKKKFNRYQHHFNKNYQNKFTQKLILNGEDNKK